MPLPKWEITDLKVRAHGWNIPEKVIIRILEAAHEQLKEEEKIRDKDTRQV